MNNLEKKIPDATTSIFINQYNTNKQSLQTKIKDVGKKVPKVSGLVNTTLHDTEIGKVENKIPDTRGLVTTAVLNTQNGEDENKMPDVWSLFNNAKISDIETKCFTLLITINLRVKTLDAKIKIKRSIDKSSISNIVKKSKLNIKLQKSAITAESKAK